MNRLVALWQQQSLLRKRLLSYEFLISLYQFHQVSDQERCTLSAAKRQFPANIHYAIQYDQSCRNDE